MTGERLGDITGEVVEVGVFAQYINYAFPNKNVIYSILLKDMMNKNCIAQ